jgi:hypothetical protein
MAVGVVEMYGRSEREDSICILGERERKLRLPRGADQSLTVSS